MSQSRKSEEKAGELHCPDIATCNTPAFGPLTCLFRWEGFNRANRFTGLPIMRGLFSTTLADDRSLNVATLIAVLEYLFTDRPINR